MVFVYLFGPFAVATLLVVAVVGRRQQLPRATRPAVARVLVLALLLFLAAALTVMFIVSVAVFDCHGGYECPV